MCNMPFSPPQFSENIRRLSPSRFRRFIGHALDIERGYPAANDSDVRRERLTKEEAFGLPDPRFSWVDYSSWQRAALGYQYIASQAKFLIVHHVPRLIASRDYLEVLRDDLTQLSELRISYSSFHYITNKNLGNWRTDLEAFQREATSILKHANISRVGCIDPYDLGAKLSEYPKMESALLEVLGEPDGIVIQVTNRAIQVRPFIASDVLWSRERAGAWVVNVDATPLLGERLSSLNGLRDVLTFQPDEPTINAFLMDHLSTLLRGKYVDIRTEITIAPTGERPDFFLERIDGLWEPMELKRPVPTETLFLQDSAGMLRLSRYLSHALSQCAGYLRLLDTREVRARLYGLHRMQIEPRITLLIGRTQYPRAVKDYVERRVDHRIELLSFEELLEECTGLTATLVQEMRTLSRK